MWVLKLLGGARLERADGSSVPFQRRALAVLAVLALAGERGISRERLAALFWPESAEEQAKGAVRQMLHVIRKAWGSPDLVLGTTELRLNTALLRTDVADLEAAARAGDAERVEQRYVGPFLDGFTLSGTEPFNRWAERERDRIAGLVREVYERRATQRSRLGADSEAAHWWRGAQALDPTDGRAALALMRALVAAGDPAAVVQHARVYAALVRAELDADPDPAITDFAQSVRAGPLASAKNSTRSIEPARTLDRCEFPEAASLSESLAINSISQVPIAREVPRFISGMNRRRLIAVALMLFTTAVAAAALWRFPAIRSSTWARAIESRSSRASATAPLRIAVIPLDMSDDTADEYLADGIVDAVRAQLAGDPRLEVIGSASSNTYRNTKTSPDSIASELHASYLVMGRFERAKPNLPVSFYLQSVLLAPGMQTPLWDRQFMIVAKGFSGASDSIATAVADHLGVVIVPPSLVERDIPAQGRARAYDAFLHGQEITEYDGTWETARLQRAVPFYLDALKEDSLLVPAWVALARTEAALFNSVPTIAVSAAAHHAVQRAQSLAPNWAGSFLAASMVEHIIDNDNRLSLSTARQGLSLSPHNVDLLIAAADGERSFGHWPAALLLYQEAVAIDPRSPRASMKLLEWYIWEREYPEALAEADRGLAFAPDNLDLRLRKVMTQVAMGDLAAARRSIAQAPPSVDRTRMAGFFSDFYDLGWVLDDSLKELLLNARLSSKLDSSTEWGELADLAMLRGDTVQARAFARHLLKTAAQHVAEFPDNAAGLSDYCYDLAFAGDRDAAVRTCQEAVRAERKFGGSFQDGSYLYDLARVSTIAGQQDVAIAALDTALNMPSFISRQELRINPNFAPLRSNPKFRQLVGLQ